MSLTRSLAEMASACLFLGDGQFYREEITAEQLEEQGRVIRDRIEDIHKHCDVLPVKARSTLN